MAASVGILCTPVEQVDVTNAGSTRIPFGGKGSIATSPFRCCRCWRGTRVCPEGHLDGDLGSVLPLSDQPGGRSQGSSTATSSSQIAGGKRHVVVKYPNGSVYEGQFCDRKRHGHGTLTLADGTKYVAEWKNDARNGEGAEFCVDGTCFMGSYTNGLRSGHGVMAWPEGSKYSGQFERGKANGDGHLLRTDGSVYKGHFVDDCMCGEGCMQWKDGVEYVGQFVSNRRDGTGTMKWTTGRWKSYEGGWKDGKQHGSGTLIDQGDQVYSGVFHWGKLVRWDEDSKDESNSLPEGMVAVPAYWSNQDLSAGFNERNEIPEAFQDQIQRLLDGTFRTVQTRDRHGGIPSRLRLLKSHRVENSKMWTRYLKAKARIIAKRPEGVQGVNLLDGNPDSGNVRTSEVLGASFMEHLDSSVNEFYLWHGTTPEGAIGISSDGFRLAFAGSHAGTFFGQGCYFAECSSKSDEYARSGESLYAGVYALLLCRVSCGSLFRITMPDHAAISKALDTGDYDSVLGDREASVGTYREFVVYDEDLIYPEYVVLYERKFDS